MTASTRIGLTAFVVAVLAWPPSAAGQVVVREGSADVSVDRRLARLLDAEPLIVTSNTTIVASDTIHRSVLVLDASLVHEGVILGDLVLVGAGAFVRPRSEVAGDLVNIAGGLYRSELARVGGTIVDLPTAPYTVVREPDRIVIRAVATPRRLVLDGLWGLRAPRYDRVNGLTAEWGAHYQLPVLGNAIPVLRGRAGWLTQRGDPTYAVDLSVQAGALTLAAGHERSWETGERWIRGDLHNSLAYLWHGRDLRDYHEVDRGWAGLTWELRDVTHTTHAVLGIRGQIEDAASLVAGEPWFIVGSGTRPNPAIDDGRITSLVASAELTMERPTIGFTGSAEYEAARQWADGEHDFDRVRVLGEWAMRGFARHTLLIDFMGQAPVRGGVLPRQRWSFVGGVETLHTLPLARYYGDHVVFIETRYGIPLPDRLALPLLGPPEIQLLHAAGMAWTEGQERELRQEAGARLQFAAVYVRFLVEPSEPSSRRLDLGLSNPFGRDYPWRR